MKTADLFSICGINVTKGRVTGMSCISLTSLEVFWFKSGFLPFQLPVSSDWELKLREVSVSLSVSSARKAVWSEDGRRGEDWVRVPQGRGCPRAGGAPGQKRHLSGLPPRRLVSEHSLASRGKFQPSAKPRFTARSAQGGSILAHFCWAWAGRDLVAPSSPADFGWRGSRGDMIWGIH